jgi:hypothetical protein
MSGEFENLAQIAADALVSAIATDSWEAVKRRFAAVAHRERLIDATRAELAATSAPDLDRVKSAQAEAWVTRLRDILVEDPGASQALTEFLAYVASLGVTPEPAPKSQSLRAGHGSVNVGGDVTGDIAAGNATMDKRRYRFFLPFMFFGHAAKQVAAHWVVTTITVVVAIGGVSAGVALTHKGTNTPAPSSTTSVVPASTHATLSGPAATLPTPTRIVLFKGGGDATPAGPAVQPAGKWTVSTAPANITTTNYGTLVEDTSLGPIGDCTAQCGEWWYNPRPGAVQLQEFYWDETNGTQVPATNLVPALANNNEWASLGDGTYTPLCLSWVVTASNNTYTLHYIKLSLDTHDWSEISSAELGTC